MPAVIDRIRHSDADIGSSLWASACSGILPVATAAMLALAFPPVNWKLLSWIALVPLGAALYKKRLFAEFYLGLYIGGLIFQLTTLDWLRSGSGGTWLSGPRATHWLAQGIGLALIWPIFFLAARPFITRLNTPMAFTLPLVWVAFEFSRKHLWAIIDVFGYPFGQLGIAQADNLNLVQIADLGGIYVVSAVVATVNGLIVDIIFWIWTRTLDEGKRFPLLTIVGVAMVFGLAWVYGFWRISQAVPMTGPVVGLMPRTTLSALDIVGSLNTDNDPALTEVTAAITSQWQGRSASSANLLVWSEGGCAIVTSYQAADRRMRNQTTIERMETFSKLTNAALVIGCTRPTGNLEVTSFNSAVVVEPARGYVGHYDKLRLVPFREFHPPGRNWFGDSDMYLRGSDYPVIKIQCGSPLREFRLAVSICYDTCFPDLYWQYMRPSLGCATPQFFVVPAFEDFDHAMRLQDDLLQLARFRAVECRRAFVRNAHQGFSGIIDGNGALIAVPREVDFDKPAVLGPIPLDERFSLYSVIGDWPAAICVAIIFIPVVLRLVVQPIQILSRLGLASDLTR